jgi:hypothetical protein
MKMERILTSLLAEMNAMQEEMNLDKVEMKAQIKTNQEKMIAKRDA